MDETLKQPTDCSQNTRCAALTICIVIIGQFGCLSVSRARGPGRDGLAA